MAGDWLYGGTPPTSISPTAAATAPASGNGVWGGFLDVIGGGFGLYMQNESLEFEREVQLRKLELQERTTQQTLDPAVQAAQAQANLSNQFSRYLLPAGAVALGAIGFYFLFKK